MCENNETCEKVLLGDWPSESHSLVSQEWQTTSWCKGVILCCPHQLKKYTQISIHSGLCSVDNSNDESGQCFVPQQRGALQPPQNKNNSMSLAIEAQAAYLLTTKSCYSSILKPFWNMTQAFFFSKNSLSLVQNNFQQYCVKLWKNLHHPKVSDYKIKQTTPLHTFANINIMINHRVCHLRSLMTFKQHVQHCFWCVYTPIFSSKGHFFCLLTAFKLLSSSSCSCFMNS